MVTKDIKKLASDFRYAMELAKADGIFSSWIMLEDFPRASCGDASDLLAQYLLENGIQTYYVSGRAWFGGENDWNHAWLELKDGTVIDITGDQFKDNSFLLNFNKTVYVGPKSEFHKLFDVPKGYPQKYIDCRKWDGRVGREQVLLFKVVSGYLPPQT